MSAAAKKREYNRVRRKCMKHGIDIIKKGEHKNYRGVELIKNGQVLISQYAENIRPLDIDWAQIDVQLERWAS